MIKHRSLPGRDLGIYHDAYWRYALLVLFGMAADPQREVRLAGTALPAWSAEFSA
jgi:hypothetical protein